MSVGVPGPKLRPKLRYPPHRQVTVGLTGLESLNPSITVVFNEGLSLGGKARDKNPLFC